MSLSEQIAADLTEAIKAQTEPDRTVLRGLSAALKNAEIDNGGPLDDAAVTKVISKQVKQREETIAAAKDSHPDLAAKEQAEADLLAKYLPEQLTETELEQLVATAITETGASGPSDMGKVMGALKAQVAGRADGATVANLVKSKLA
jgi:uncharacterized protein YqeY